jgi:DNA mismatch endonuclease (patch repair protein)
MRANKSRDTRPEVLLRSALHRRGLRFRKHFMLREDQVVVRPDVVFTRARVVVFVDGCYWHCCPTHGSSPRHNAAYWTEKFDRNVARDHRVDEALRASGWTVLRYWEHVDPVEAASDVEQVLEGHRPLLTEP